MPDYFAIYSGVTVTAVGTTAELWPHDSFPQKGPSAEFLTAKSAQKVLTSIAVTRYQKQVAAALYVAGDGKIYNVQTVALTAQELTAALTAYQAQRVAAVQAEYRNRIDAYMSGIERARNLGKIIQTIKTRLFSQASALPIAWTGGQLAVWDAGKAVLDWFDAMKTTSDNAATAINAITTASADCLDAVDTVVASISWPAAP